MAKLFRALASFDYLADSDSLKKKKQARETDDPEKKAALLSDLHWAHHDPKDKPFSAPNAEMEKSWLAWPEVVEEVSAGG